MENTLSFYGYYQPALLRWGAENDIYYDISLAYQLTIYSAIFFSLVCIIYSVAEVL